MVATRRSKFEDVPMEFDKNNAQVSQTRSVSNASETSSQIFEAVKRAQELAAQMKPQKAVAVAQKPSKIQKCGCTWKRDR